ncbi:MAG: putative toxin-antitoxin system toxin component, PIN family [Anaerolineales bacterium]
MKVVLDTNVFVSGVFFSGPPYQILQAWKDGKIQMVVSPEILDEYRRVGEVLAEEHPAISLEPVLAYVIQNAVAFSVIPLPEKVCEDPDDDKFLACALASGSNLVVSGDRHLLKVSGYQNIEVLKPRYFLDKYLG